MGAGQDRLADVKAMQVGARKASAGEPALAIITLNSEIARVHSLASVTKAKYRHSGHPNTGAALNIIIALGWPGHFFEGLRCEVLVLDFEREVAQRNDTDQAFAAIEHR
jgi:hypothetical protein